MVRLFVKQDKDILKIIKESISKCEGNIQKLSDETNICRTTIYHWLDHVCWVDIIKFVDF